jgi:hypothetical protein
VGWYEFARASQITDRVMVDARVPVTLYGYLEDGKAFEIRRRGRLEGSASVYLVSCRGDEVTVTDPRVAALHRAQARRAEGCTSGR